MKRRPRLVHHVPRNAVVAIRDWLLGQMRQDMERVGPLIEPPVGKDSAA
jgi:hypothetical protein